MRARSPLPKEIRDPIHGGIQLDAHELAVVDHPFVQRLRGIRQLGFSHLPFPGATHTRYAHSLGAMHLAGRAFDACFRDQPFTSPQRAAALRHVVRLAALCHDLGHGPFSHAAEFAMPPLRALGIGAYAADRVAGRIDQRAHHEDATIAVLTRSGLSGCIGRHFPFQAIHVAGLVSADVHISDDFFVEDGLDLRGVLSQLVSSELDVDRLDYLVRDSYYTGARYGQVDVSWLVSHLTRHVGADGQVCLGLDRRAIYAFDDFMIARFHMFVMVYFHQKSVAYEQLLQRWTRSADCDWTLPAEMDAFLQVDDAALEHALRASPSHWAQRIVQMRPYKVAWEAHGAPNAINPGTLRLRLEQAGIDVIEAEATGAVFREPKPGQPPIYVVGEGATPTRLREATSIFHRYETERSIRRLYVPREHLDAARGLLGS